MKIVKFASAVSAALVAGALVAQEAKPLDTGDLGGRDGTFRVTVGIVLQHSKAPFITRGNFFVLHRQNVQFIITLPPALVKKQKTRKMNKNT